MADGGMCRAHDTRRDVLSSEITAALRGYAVDAQHIGNAFAGRYGLGGTDLQALIAVMDAEGRGEPLTPGRLGEHLNLSSGSITALLDRLERAGHIRRDRDTADRRKVFLRYGEPGARLAVEFFGPIGRRTDQVMDPFTDDELEVVLRFLRTLVDSMREHRDDIRTGRPDRLADPPT